MHISQAVRTATWLSDNFREYLLDMHDNPRPSIIDRKSDWSRQEAVHASKLAACPKKQALKDYGLIEEIHSDYNLLRMEEGTAMGRVAQQYMYWLADNFNKTSATGAAATFEHEYHLYEELEALSGTADGLMTMWQDTFTSEHFPIEVKLTDAWRFEGINVDYVAQVSSYIMLKQNQLRMNGIHDQICDTGFVFTLHDKKEADKAWAVWIVQRVDEGYNIYNSSGQPVPLRGLPEARLTDQQIQRWIAQHRRWKQKVKEGGVLPNETPYLDPIQRWECAEVISPEFREKAWTDPVTKTKHAAGTLKKNTGIVTPRCQAFHLCWQDWLIERGIDPQPNMREIRMNIAREAVDNGVG